MFYTAQLSLQRTFAAIVIICIFATVSGYSQVLLQDNFDSYPLGAFPSSGGWQLQYNGYGDVYQFVTLAHSASSPNSLKLEGACGNTGGANHSLLATKPLMSLTFKFKMEKLEGPCLPFALMGGGFKCDLTSPTDFYGFNVGFDGNDNPNIDSLSLAWDQWHAAAVEVDTLAKSFSVWINGKRVRNHISYTGQPNPNAIFLHSSNSRHTRTYFDDVEVTGSNSNPFCDGFEDGNDWQSTWQDVCGSQVVVPSPTHSGSGALQFQGPVGVCYPQIERSWFQAEYGEYSAWHFQTNPNGGRIYIMVSPAGDPTDLNHQSYCLGFGAGDGMGGGTFQLSRIDEAGNGTILFTQASPQFVMNQWVRFFVRNEGLGRLRVGYEHDSISFDTLIVDPAPLTQAGEFHLLSCSGPSNLYDDVCFTGFGFGDADGNGIVTISDAVFLINYIFGGGFAPDPLSAADADCNGFISISDCVYIINYIFMGGPVPGANCLRGAPPMIAKSTIGSASVATASSAFDNRHIVEVNLESSAAVRAVQLDFTVTGEVHNIQVTSGADQLQLFSGAIGNEYRVGLIDLTGTAAIPAGSSKVAVVSYEGTGELSIASATVVDNDAAEMTVTIGNTKLESSLPLHYELAQNQPNPFNPSTDINFSLPKTDLVKLVVYNILGEEIAVLVDEIKAAGVHRVTWDGKDKSGRAVASGVYFYKLIASDFSQSRKMLLLK